MVYEYVIHDIPPSNNQYMGKSANPYKYQRKKKEWAAILKYECYPKPKKPIRYMDILITYFFRDDRKRDPDNYSGKFILDGMKLAGIIEDDSFDNIRFHTVCKGGVDRKKPRTVIRVEEIE